MNTIQSHHRHADASPPAQTYAPVGSASGAPLGRRLYEADVFFYQLGAPDARRCAALDALEHDGTYRHTLDELVAGAQWAWRNNSRCAGRAFWRAAQTVDARHCASAAEIAGACFQHLHRAYNSGRLRPLVTVGPPLDPDGRGFRILNPQLISYAGYRNDDNIVGDQANVGLTRTLQRLGWQGSSTRFDVLPLLIQTPERQLEWFALPPETVHQIPITHPRHPAIDELGLRWHAVPTVSEMSLEIGGLTYPVAPWSGWHTGDEIGVRILGDTRRYNQLGVVAAALGLDTHVEETVRCERAAAELTTAVLHSFSAAGVRIAGRPGVRSAVRDTADGHAPAGQWRTASASRTSRHSASAVPTLHRYDDDRPELRPGFVQQPCPPLDRLGIDPAPTNDTALENIRTP
ncbi:nitric oxide synthase oxygenase [Nocardia sp. XZ_19_369]|uniref:nitric oxide synthase oxygenase n=1 Tax=Nocardia sp. XZ_19_369 TaxID=2769487 RepID=UPI00188EDE30|nr:nitric oxide synthase oxygenase [Nocardia sp. XZ_19_369]